jgi:soluble lytic murein transglycosylase-like protein
VAARQAPKARSQSTGAQAYAALAEEYGKQYGVPPALLLGLVEVESGGNPRAVSPTGDVGLTQIHLASHPGVTRAQAENPRFAMAWTARYLSRLYRACGSWEGALTQYNHGTAMGCAPSAYSQKVLQAAARYGPAPAPSAPSSGQAPEQGAPAWVYAAVAALVLVVLVAFRRGRRHG